MIFFLGVPEPSWLARSDVPMMVSHNRLRRVRRTFPRAAGPWVLDSGAFTSVSKLGHHVDTPRAYAGAVRTYRDEVGNLIWAATQDWMCEEHVLARTGLTQQEHMLRTIESFIELSSIAPDLPWLPTLQGNWEEHLVWWDKAGIDLRKWPTVGMGSICRLQAVASVRETVRALAQDYGLRLHGYGVKKTGLILSMSRDFVSTDSMAWSYAAKRGGRRASHLCCTHDKCVSCFDWAMEWREELLRDVGLQGQVNL